MRTCAGCGCPRVVHEHYRPGSDCGACGHGLCPAYLSPWRGLLVAARRDIDQRVELALMRLAWRLPRRLVEWAAIRVVANATGGRHAGQVVPELTAMEALSRWHDDQEVGRP